MLMWGQPPSAVRRAQLGGFFVTDGKLRLSSECAREGHSFSCAIRVLPVSRFSA
jgi:hypothetical protein